MRRDNERKALTGDNQKKAAAILNIHSVAKVYKSSGMAIECGDGGIIAVVYEKQEAAND